MHSQFTLAARRRILNSLLISGGVHVSAASLFLLGVSFGWLPEPYATHSDASSVELVASVVSVASEEADVKIRIDLDSEVPPPKEYEQVPPSIQSLFPTKDARISVPASTSLEVRLLEKLSENREQVVLLPAPINQHQLAARKRIEAYPGNPSKPPAANPPKRKVDPHELKRNPAQSQVAMSQAAQVNARENRGAEFDRLPTPVINPAPVYPADALAERREGRVILRAFVDDTGDVSEVIVWRSSGDEQFDLAALAAVREWKFTPGQRMGQNASGEVAIPVVFQIAK